MDSVPYAFCEDVLERLSKENLDTMADDLSGQWRSAAQRFLEKRRSFYIIISKDREGLFYTVTSKPWYIENDPHSHEEFLSMDRRYIEVCHTSIYSNPRQLDARKFRCSKKDMVRRAVPFLTLRMRPDSPLFFMSECPKEFTLECLDMFRRCFSFGELELVYVGPESEEFLGTQLKTNPFLCSLTLCCWPHTETTEQLILTFLNSKRKRNLNMAQFSDIQSPPKVTIRIVKAAVDSWAKGGERTALTVYGNIGVSREEILSIPVPDNVTKREEEAGEEGDFRVRWTKEDGSSLEYDVTISSDRFSLPFY
ncbi:hypothetical protein QR680_010437 [Steinernema hermaphroditum]|uniref:Uncharacterized protein n=1 Tax=Steinernema hermaphroditum TaxID=289476 RepID=A0AA39IQF1_9BILA|nr:hypothetical protein QR680_010437 [Steinernema hermaphroditum]